MTTLLSPHDLEVALELRDLSDPAGGPHAMQSLLDDVLAALDPPDTDDVTLVGLGRT